jgi:drug efflux transport system ATP-binding protein
MDAIRFSNVSKRYGATRALDAVSFEIARGEMFGVIGPDGAGKTTAIRLACGLLRADAGQILVQGRDPVREHRAITHQIGYLSQRFSLYGDLTIDENIAFFAEIHSVRRYQAARDRLLAMTQLTPFRGRRADRLSGGMKQKLALACTLVHEPDVLLLDEPTTGVDPVSRREFWKLLSEFLTGGLTIVMTTPYLDEAERCARVALLHEGRLLAIDRPSALQATLSGRLVEVIVDAGRPPLDILSAVEGVEDVQAFGDRAHVRLAGGSQMQGAARITEVLRARGITVLSARPVAATLEDVFIGLITARTDGGEARSGGARTHA